MEREANKTLIGGFVVGALVLVVAGVVLFGSGNFFAETVRYVLYFDSSVKGLNVGSPVVFRGVKVGSVTDIALIADARLFSVEIPVYIEVEPESFQIKKMNGDVKVDQYIEPLIAHGLRAQLQSQSLVTGQLMVELDFYDDKPAILRGKGDGPPEIPTIPSTLQSLVQALKDLKLDETSRDLSRVVAGIENLVNSPQIAATVVSLQQAITSADSLLINLDSRLGPLLDSVEQTVQTAEGLMNNVDAQIVPLVGELRETARTADRAIGRAEETLVQMEGILGQDAPLVYQLNMTLKDLAGASRAVRAWAEYMERHPEALLRGKK